jgi:hypothetical protein
MPPLCCPQQQVLMAKELGGAGLRHRLSQSSGADNQGERMLNKGIIVPQTFQVLAHLADVPFVPLYTPQRQCN